MHFKNGDILKDGFLGRRQEDGGGEEEPNGEMRGVLYVLKQDVLCVLLLCLQSASALISTERRLCRGTPNPLSPTHKLEDTPAEQEALNCKSFTVLLSLRPARRPHGGRSALLDAQRDKVELYHEGSKHSALHL